MKKLKIFFILLPVLSILLSLFFLANEGRKKESRHPVTPNIAEQINLTGFNRGEKRFTLEGKVLSLEGMRVGPFIFGLDTKVNLKDARVTFFKDGQPASILTADNAKADKKDLSGYKRINFSGDVTVITADSRTLTCETLTWENKNDLILARGNCILRYEGKAAKGDFIGADAQLRNFKAEEKKGAVLFSMKGD